MIITGKERAVLRRECNQLRATVHMGHAGMTQEFLDALKEALRYHELVKVQLNRTVDGDRKGIAAQLAEAMGAEPVQTIGRTTTIYRHNPAIVRKPGDLPPWKRKGIELVKPGAKPKGPPKERSRPKGWQKRPDKKKGERPRIDDGRPPARGPRPFARRAEGAEAPAERAERSERAPRESRGFGGRRDRGERAERGEREERETRAPRFPKPFTLRREREAPGASTASPSRERGPRREGARDDRRSASSPDAGERPPRSRPAGGARGGRPSSGGAPKTGERPRGPVKSRVKKNGTPRRGARR
ncbi:MAG: YhbY family RNA-binding protein [Gemmatimonadaceae bacterium]|nr:YhbY family RNA-binding protein [Gemmatimonadaceae bacterium]